MKGYLLSETCLFWEMTYFLRELNVCSFCHCVCLFLEECDLKIASLLSTGAIKIPGVLKKKMKGMPCIFLREMCSRLDFPRQAMVVLYIVLKFGGLALFLKFPTIFF